jgi:CheY-like chemotaxis protein
MDGLTATRAILADDPNARIIVLTTYDGDDDIHRALAAGARGYLLEDMRHRRARRDSRGAPLAARHPGRSPPVSPSTALFIGLRNHTL